MSYLDIIIIFKRAEEEERHKRGVFKQIIAPTEKFAPRRQNEPGATAGVKLAPTQIKKLA
jgi:hypothetical protein